MDIEIVCRNFDNTPPEGGNTSQRSCAWPLPLNPDQLRFLLDIAGMFQKSNYSKDLHLTTYRLLQVFVLATVLKGYLRRNPWLHALMDVLNTDKEFKKDWELRVRTPDESHIEFLLDQTIELVDVVEIPKLLEASTAFETFTREIETDLQSREDLFDLNSPDMSESVPVLHESELSDAEIDSVIANIGV